MTENSPMTPQMALFTLLDQDQVIAEAIVAVYEAGHEEGKRIGFRRGVDWGNSIFSRWYWMPAVFLPLLLGVGVGFVAAYGALQ